MTVWKHLFPYYQEKLSSETKTDQEVIERSSIIMIQSLAIISITYLGLGTLSSSAYQKNLSQSLYRFLKGNGKHN